MQVLGTRRHRVGQVFVSVGGKTTNITATAFFSIFYLDQRERVEKRQVNGVQTQNKRQRGARASHSVSLLCVFSARREEVKTIARKMAALSAR